MFDAFDNGDNRPHLCPGTTGLELNATGLGLAAGTIDADDHVLDATGQLGDEIMRLLDGQSFLDLPVGARLYKSFNGQLDRMLEDFINWDRPEPLRTLTANLIDWSWLVKVQGPSGFPPTFLTSLPRSSCPGPMSSPCS